MATKIAYVALDGERDVRRFESGSDTVSFDLGPYGFDLDLGRLWQR